MEKKKLLLVAVSVGVFLVIVISASILIFTPRAGATAALSAARPISTGPGASLPPFPSSLDSASLVKNAGEIRGIQPSQTAHTVQDTQFYINGEPPFAETAAGKPAEDAAAHITINVPSPRTAAVPDVQDAPPPPAEIARPAVAVAKTAPVKSVPKQQAKPAPVKQAPAKTSPAPAKPAAIKSSQPVFHDYWVQTGAFSTKIRAEGVKETLESKGITSIIVNREQNGKTLFRVRVGPYTSKTEANYWLKLVQSIDEFSGSMVFETPRL
jgi:DedD protein